MIESKLLFRKVGYDLGDLLVYIKKGNVALPAIQRPFIWPDKKVRDLLDSMYRGFPVGYLLFWANTKGEKFRPIGLGEKTFSVPGSLIIDGQQRLTSLYAVFNGEPVIDKRFKTKYIEIAFRPKDGFFETANAANLNDPEFIPNISRLWTSRETSYDLIKEFLTNLKSKRQISKDEENAITTNINTLYGLSGYHFEGFEMAENVKEEEVAKLFVRVNKEGVPLKETDFILTLMSVFWNEGRVKLERFCYDATLVPQTGKGASPYNHFIQPSPDRLLRVTVALAFSRGRMERVYPVLRGKDIETGEFKPEKRDEQFKLLRDAQEKVLDLKHWHQFFSSLVGAGFRSKELISSEITMLYAYVFYLIGKTQYNVAEHKLQSLIGRWFFATSLSQRYSGSYESTMDSDLNRIGNLPSAETYVTTLEKIIDDTLTKDFWSITLPNNLETSSLRTPWLFAYHVAQNVLGAPVLFSHKKISDLLDPTIKATKKAIELHHLFPKGWFKTQGITDRKVVNQNANMALLEWTDNIEILDEPPSSYVSKIKKRFSQEAWEMMCELHALPEGWENVPYEEFLAERRKLMAQIIKRGFETL